MGGDEITFHHLRRRVQTLVERGQVLRRVKHKSFNKAAATGYKWSYSGPVYEYRRKVDVDDLAE